jgi:hypothetical protein
VIDEVDVGPVYLTEELSRVRGQRLDVTALTLREDRVEGERRLSGAGEPREHHEGVTWNLEIHVLQIVNTGTVDAEDVGGIYLRN